MENSDVAVEYISTGFILKYKDKRLELYEYTEEPYRGYLNLVIRMEYDSTYRRAFDVDIQGWDNAIKTLETIERLVSKAIELAKEYKAKGDSNG